MAYALSFSRITQDNDTTGKTITGMSTHADGTQCIAAAHGFSDGDFIEISGTTNYDGAYFIENVTTNNFTIPVTYSSTQAGTAYKGNKDWVDVGSIDGATREVLGDDAGSRAIALYLLAARHIRISGAQYMDPTSEYLMFKEDAPDNVLEIASGGILRVGEERTNDDDSVTTPVGPFLVIGKKGTHHANEAASQILVQDGGTLEIYGGTMITQGATRWSAGSKIRIKDTVWYNALGVETQLPSKFPAFLSPRIYSTDVEIENLRIIGGTFEIHAASGVVINGIRPERMEGGIGVNEPGIAVSSFYTIKGVDGNHGSVVDIGMFNGQKARATNCRLGSETIVEIASIGHNTRSFGVGEITQEIEFEIRDAAGDLKNVRIYGKDYNVNNDRVDWTAKNDFGGNASTAVDYATDREHNAITTNGKLKIDQLTAGRVYNSPAQGTSIAMSHRCISGDTTDDFEYVAWAYDTLGSVIQVIAKGLVPVKAPRTVFADTMITKTSGQASLISGIAINFTTKIITCTENHTYDDIYDYIKWQKYTIAGVKLPTPKTLLAVPNGNDLGLRDYAIVVNGCTISTGVKFRTLTTTAAVTFVGTGKIAGVYTDSSGKTLELHTDPVETLFRIEEFNASGATLLNTYGEIGEPEQKSDSDGIYRKQFGTDSTLRIYQKAYGYSPQRTNHDMADGSELDLTLARVSHIDITQDLSAFLGESDTGTTDRLWFDYDATNHKGNWVVGEIDTEGEFVRTAALLDHRISTADGLAFFAYFNVQDGVADHLSGHPYVWSHDKLELNEDYMQFLRITGMTGVQGSRLGVPPVKKDGISKYEAPDSNNSQVKFDNAAINISEASLTAISNKTQTKLERDGGKLDNIEGQTDRLTYNDDDELAVQGGSGGGGLTEAQSTKLDNLDTRLTDDRAALIDDINTDVETLIARRAFSSTDSARISGTNTNTTTMNNRMTSARAARLDANISSRAAPSDVPTTQEITDAVWDELTADITAASSIGAHLKGLTSGGGGGSGLTADQEAQLDSIETNTDRLTAANIALLANLDAAVSTRATQTSVDARPSSGDISQAVGAPSTADIQAAIERSSGPLQSIKTTVEAIPATAAPIATVVAQAVWDVLASDVTTANSIGKELKDNVLLALRWSRTYPNVGNDVLIMEDALGELGRFVPRTTIPTTDYSGGFEPE